MKRAGVERVGGLDDLMRETVLRNSREIPERRGRRCLGECSPAEDKDSAGAAGRPRPFPRSPATVDSCARWAREAEVVSFHVR